MPSSLQGGLETWRRPQSFLKADMTTRDLKTLRPSPSYRSGRHLIGPDFYCGMLQQSRLYCRAVGYFSSSAFGVASTDFADFFGAGCTMHLICSPWLAYQDVDAFRTAIQHRARVLKEGPTSPLRWLERFHAGQTTWPDSLSWLIARGLLKVKIALVGREDEGVLYHEKLGYFKDDLKQLIAYQGSANESKNGLMDNFERIEVYADWWDASDRRRAHQLELHFDQLWSNQTDGLEVISLREACQRGLLRVRPGKGSSERHHKPPPSVSIDSPLLTEVLIPPQDMTPYRHQLEAISAWGKAGGSGILGMATGSGKTFAALTAASRVHDRLGGKPFALLIVAPFIHLVDQWCSEAQKFGLEPIRCAEGVHRWQSHLSSAVYALNQGGRSVLSIAVTQRTLGSNTFQEELSHIRQSLMVIADEVHNYGTPRALESLPSHAQLRMGLSATPERWMDEDGTEGLKEYFGDVVYAYGLKEAIEDGVLTPYSYHPVLVELDEGEVDTYLDLTRLLSRYMHFDETDVDNENVMKLLVRRARLIASARSKLPKLRALMEDHRHKSHILVYCGDGQVEVAQSEETLRQVSAVAQMLNRDLNMTAAIYTAETSARDRQTLLDNFADGTIQALVAIRCLDEGVDIPETHTAFLLASSTNPKQFVQRRGRVLRRSPHKKQAEIHDFFVVPPCDEIQPGDTNLPVMRRLFKRQLDRADEFTKLAKNGPVARQVLMEVAERLDLVGHW